MSTCISVLLYAICHMNNYYNFINILTEQLNPHEKKRLYKKILKMAFRLFKRKAEDVHDKIERKKLKQKAYKQASDTYQKVVQQFETHHDK